MNKKMVQLVVQCSCMVVSCTANAAHVTILYSIIFGFWWQRVKGASTLYYNENALVLGSNIQYMSNICSATCSSTNYVHCMILLPNYYHTSALIMVINILARNVISIY